jgi:glycine/D-amino acid oxidase-like deaminating enzyme
MNADVIVIGGGLVGSAIAYGLSKDARVLILDEGDRAFRATRGNFGLVWVQSKGVGAPHYARWSKRSADLWADFAAELKDATGIDTHHKRTGGVHLLLTEQEVTARAAMMEQLRREAGNDGYECEMLDAAGVKNLLPSAGPRVLGASYTPYDGVANPLFTIRALHTALAARGARYEPGHTVGAIEKRGDSFTVKTDHAAFTAPKLVIAAGLGTRKLGEMVGIAVPVHPQRGQVLVTERLAPGVLGGGVTFTNARQMVEGGVIMGDSQEDVGFDNRTTVPVMSNIAARAIACFPVLEKAQIVRAWGALRVMSPDGLPIYAESKTMPGAFAATCHSGVTLCAAHAREIARWIAGGERPEPTLKLVPERFDVPKAA